MGMAITCILQVNSVARGPETSAPALGRFSSTRVKKEREKSDAGLSTSSACASRQAHQEALGGHVLALCEQTLLDTNLSKEKQQPLREKDTVVKGEMASCYLHTSSAAGRLLSGRDVHVDMLGHRGLEQEPCSTPSTPRAEPVPGEDFKHSWG
ncbi:protein diaphanous homolog 1-like [Spheniscus humboldti]